MAGWLFGRGSRRKRSRTDVDDETSPSAATMRPYTGPARQRSGQKKPRHEPNKLQRRARYSFESGRADNIAVAGARPANEPIGYFYGTAQGSKLSGDVHDYTPTLRRPSKRDRTKGSKRRKNVAGLEREAELRAQSRENVYNQGRGFTPLRPAVDPWSAGRTMKRETIKAHGNFRRHGRDKGQHPSDVSLPLADSIDSAMSSDSEQIAFSVSPLAALAPMPTLRYVTPHHPGQSAGDGAFPQRRPSHKHRLAQPISEDVLKAHKRVDDLADNLDASDLRELMERDTRRRERKRRRDQERAEQRLRRAEQQLQQEAVAGPSTSANLDRGVLGREAAGMGADKTTSTVVTSSTRRESHHAPISPPDSAEDVQPPHSLNQHASVESSGSDTSVIEELHTDAHCNRNSATSSQLRRSPVEEFYRAESIPEDPVDAAASTSIQASDEFEPPLPLSSKPAEKRKVTSPMPERTNSKLRRLISLRKRRSTGSSLEARPGGSVSRKTSETSSIRGLSWGSLAILFRFRHKAKRDSEPSSFSNLSRDSMTAQAPPRLQAQARSHWQRQSQSLPIQYPPPVLEAAEPREADPTTFSSGFPHRTLSRFREDLPDFLMSPPASREASVEAEHVPPVPTYAPITEEMQEMHTQYFEEDEGADADEDEEYDDEPIMPTTVHMPQESELRRNESSLSSNRERSSMRDTPTSWLRMEDKPSPEPQLAMSLASIDSEGSWLSGRRSRQRNSAQNSAQAANSLDNIARAFPMPSRRDHGQRYSQPWFSNEMDDDMQVDDMQDTYMADVVQYSEVASFSTVAEQDDILPSSDDEGITEGIEEEEMDDARWGSVSQRKMTTLVTTAAVGGMKSREVLKSFYEGEDGGSDSLDSPMSLVCPVSPISPVSPSSQDSSDFKDEEAGIQRAKSVNLGKGHARQISAGSAKLLEIAHCDSFSAAQNNDMI